MDYIKAQETRLDLLQGLKAQTLESSHMQKNPTVLPLMNSSQEDLHRASPSPVSKLLEEFTLDCCITNETADSSVIYGKGGDQSYFLVNGKDHEDGKVLFSTAQSFDSSPIKQKPPAVSKKPKLSLVPLFNAQAINEPVPMLHIDPASLSQTEDQVDAPQTQIKEDEKWKRCEQQEEDTSESLEILGESSEASIEIQDESCISASASQETGLDRDIFTNGQTCEEEEDGDGSSTAGSISPKEYDTGEFE